MSGSYGNYLEKKVQDYVFGKVAFTPPDTLYIAFSRADPTDDDSGLDEPVGNGYERKAIANNKTTFTNATDPNGIISNAIEISSALATGSWGEITHIAIMDALSNGNMLGHADIPIPKTVSDGDTLTFKAGELDITLV